MQHTCTVTVLKTPCFEGLQRMYLADPASDPCPSFAVRQEFTHRTPGRDGFWDFGRHAGRDGEPFPRATCATCENNKAAGSCEPAACFFASRLPGLLVLRRAQVREQLQQLRYR